MSQRTTPRLYYGYIIVFFSLLVAAVVWGSQRTFGVFPGHKHVYRRHRIAVSPLAAGAIYDKMQSYNLAVVLCSILSVAGLILLQFLKKPEVKTI